MMCCVCGTMRGVQRYGSTEIPLCEEHGKGMKVSNPGCTDSCDAKGFLVSLGYFDRGTGGGRRVIRSTKSLI
jgi:hypothetical protein